MIGLILAWLFATALCTRSSELPALGVSFVQLRAHFQTVGKDGAVISKMSAGTNGTQLKPLVTRVKDFVAHRILHKHRSRVSWYDGCTDPEATNYDRSAGVDDDSCYYGDRAPDEDYSFSENQRMSPGDAQVMYQIGHIVGKLFDKYDIRWWVTDGSLLGALRNKGIIPHDDDIDLNVLLPQVPVLKTNVFRNELHRNGLHLDDEIRHKDRIYIWNFSEYKRTRGHPNERGTRMKLDLWPLEHREGILGGSGVWQQLITTEHAFPEDLCQARVPTRMPNITGIEGFPWEYSCSLERRRFGLDDVWAPHQLTAERYLTKRYGAWDSAPECKGTLHDCHLIENVTHDMLRYAEPAGPLVDIVKSRALRRSCYGNSIVALALLLRILVTTASV